MKFTLKKIKYKNILDIDNLEINENSVSIIGKSGCGKSTLLKILANIISVDSGEYFIDEKNINEFDSTFIRREITLLSQKPIIYSGSIKDNLVIGLKYQNKIIPNEEKMLELLDIFSIKYSLNNTANNLSLGEQQRICMIRVLLLQSKVYLLDEPTSSLDKETEDIVIKNFFKITKMLDSQVIFVTHNQNLATKYADRIIKIAGGKIYEYN